MSLIYSSECDLKTTEREIAATAEIGISFQPRHLWLQLVCFLALLIFAPLVPSLAGTR